MMRQEDISTSALLCKLAQLTPGEKQALLRHIDAMLPGGTGDKKRCPNWTPPGEQPTDPYNAPDASQ